ncbi:MAG: TonB-dependent receptor [Proteobacteria bacterium]|uniref:TonB-dependent receptor plug domain-containing protein n=1 Tax=Rudaea sp. TaxID=2136325 RepID=UPI00321FBDA6|nr:TonB-dependent receptor [Pseudomonadota bacterium]
MKQRVLVSSIIMGLYASLAIGNAMAQSADDQSQEKKKETTELQGVTVTGSLIPRAQIETASPTVTITNADMKREGFKNVYDAIRSLPAATGAVQDSQFTQGFTPGANTVSLLGLDPSFTLVLMNGRPMADFPFLYNSSSNFVDLATIPMMIVDHIDILPGNQSAIYGSAAIAGVVNIVLKQKMDGVDLNFRVGGYTDGGGASQRLQLGGGHSWGNLDVLFGLELTNQNPVYFRQRDFTDSAADNPTLNGSAPIASRDRVIRNAFTGKYVDPGAATCAPMSNLFHGTLKYSQRPNFGSYCGSIYDTSDGTMYNEQKFANGYLSLKYQLNDTTQIYGDGLLNYTKIKYHTGGSYSEFYSAPGLIYDKDSKKLLDVVQYILAPEEVQGANDGTLLQRNYIVNFGVRGAIGSSNFNYDAYYHRSQSNVDSKRRRFLAEPANNWFLGAQDGVDPYGYGYPAYHLTQTGHFWNQMTPADYMKLSDVVRSNSETYTQNVNVTVTNTDLFALPAGSVGFAGLVEAGDQSWDNPVDPRITAGDFLNIGGTSGSGTRDRQAAAAEFTIPVFSMLTVDAAGRYDRYSAAGSSQGKFTYKLGLEFRPLDSLLFRANYGTAFRAPDMGYVFSTGSSFFNSYTDYYNCRRVQGDAYTNCNPPYNSVQVKGFSNGNKNLKYITADSFGYGAVWSPSSNFNIKVDYYNVKLKNEVSNYDPDTILQKEADCRFGHTRGGTPVDGNSPACQQFISQVGRNPLTAQINPGGLNTITTYPINIATEKVSGIMAQAAYRLETGRFGDFIFRADYNTTLEHVYKQFPDDPDTDLLRLRQYGNQFKWIGSGKVTWDIGPWSTTLYGVQYGPTWSYNGKFQVGPWTSFNGSVQYNFSDDASMTLIGNNLFDKRPPRDSSFSAFPYYDIFSYNGLGRLVMLEMNVHFGGSKK